MIVWRSAIRSHRLTSNPFVALWLSAAVAVLSTWVGLGVAYAAPAVPPSFGILATASGVYLLAFLVITARRPRASSGSSVEVSPRTGA